jgi:hypothetical protein
MVMRLLLSAALLTAACNLTPPCAKTARLICEAGSGEQDACQFLLNRARDDAQAQGVCKDILPAAVALGQDPQSQTAQNDWQEARRSLEVLGFHKDFSKADIGNKLINSGGLGGKVVRDLRDHSKEAEEKTNAAAEHALQGEGQ